MTTYGTTPSPEAAAAPPDENAAILQALEAEAKRAGVRLPRRGEDRDQYLLRIARNKGAIAQDAHVPDVAGTVKALLDRASDDEFFGGSPIGRALLTGASIAKRMAPSIQGVGDLADRQRGVPRLMGLLLAELRDDPTRAERLSAVELEWLATWTNTTPVADAVLAIAAARERALQGVAEAVAQAAQHYSLPEPPAPTPEREAVPLGRGSRLSRESLSPLPRTPIVSAAELARSR